VDSKEIDMEKVTESLLKAGYRVRAVETTGDPEKYREVVRRVGEELLELVTRGLTKDEVKKLADEKITAALRELEEAGVEYKITPLFGEWPPPPTSEN
jgi:CO dehydrogenase/acetyl-CoA synthase gamma subunit (corrinoid Fe-S protein)